MNHRDGHERIRFGLAQRQAQNTWIPSIKRRSFRQWLGDCWRDAVWPSIKVLVVIGVALFGMERCSGSAWWQEHNRQEKAASLAAATPHVIREAAGCKVYAFDANGRTHYFTRCPLETTTEATQLEHHGKTATVVPETIVTPNVRQ